MAVKILHAADFHLDSPFAALPDNKAAERRKEQRDLLKRISELAAREKVEVMLLAGDLLDSSSAFSETCESILRFCKDVDAQIFISPGNHDWFCTKSPYSFLDFPENVHIFKSPAPRCVPLPELECRVWGAGFNATQADSLLKGFSTNGDGKTVDLMVLHGELNGKTYNPIPEREIEGSGLDYLALGHVHAFSGVHKAGGTFYAYPGCPEGRGFDETGDKGVLVGTVSKGSCDLRFVPVALRKYAEISVDLTGAADAAEVILAALPADTSRDVYRVLLTGATEHRPDTGAVADKLKDRFYHLILRDDTWMQRDLWDGCGEDTLRGLFLQNMRRSYDSADEKQKGRIMEALKYGLAAIDNREEWRP